MKPGVDEDAGHFIGKPAGRANDMPFPLCNRAAIQIHSIACSVIQTTVTYRPTGRRVGVDARWQYSFQI